MSLKVWLPLNGNLKNLGTGNVTVTNYGATVDNDGKTGKCYSFDGSDDRIQISNAPQPTDISVAMWFKRNATTNTRQFLYTQWYGITLELTSNNYVQCSVYTASGSQTAYCSSPTTITADTGWTHICFVFKNGVGTSLYINGEHVSSASLAGPINISSTVGNIGYYSTYFNGKINDFRIYDEAISPELIHHLSRQPCEGDLKLWLPLNTDLQNYGTEDLTVTNNGSTYQSTGGKLGGYYTSQFSISNNSTVNNLINFLNSGADFSISLWFRYTTNTPGEFFQCGDSSAVGSRLHLAINDNVFRFCFRANDYSGPTLSMNTWYHVVCSYTNNKKYIYLNGSLYGSADSGKLAIPQDRGLLFTSASVHLNDFRLYSYALSPEEVKRIAQGLVLHYTLSGHGGENLFKKSGFLDVSTFGSPVADYSRPLAIYNGSVGLHSFSDGVDTVTLSTSGNIGICFVDLATNINLDPSSYYTISCWSKTTKPNTHLDIGLSYYNQSDSGVWRGGTGSQNYNAVNTWQYFTRTFKPDADTKAICYCFTVGGTSGGTDTFSIKECKLEKGDKATPWIPNPADGEYSTMGLDGTIEYDVSRFNHNGTKMGTIVTDTNTPRYTTSYKFSGACSVNGGKISNIISQGITEYTANIWCYKEDWTSESAELFSCAESGGFAMDTVTNGFRSWSHVYTNPEKTTYAYITFTQNYTFSPGWHMFTLVDDLSGTKSYIDGELVRTQASTNYGLHLNTNANLYIGAESGGTSYTTPYLNGNASDFRLYATALSADDVRELYKMKQI